jgi:hypothetical protein
VKIFWDLGFSLDTGAKAPVMPLIIPERDIREHFEVM